MTHNADTAAALNRLTVLRELTAAAATDLLALLAPSAEERQFAIEVLVDEANDFARQDAVSAAVDGSDPVALVDALLANDDEGC